jgi:hypothetical protein
MQQERVIMTERVTGPAQPDTGTTRYAYGTSYAFESPGGYLLKIADINGSAESVEIPIQVTPEYHSVMIGLSVLAAAVAATVIVTSSATLKRNWFSQ